jgi:hypothetical protein
MFRFFRRFGGEVSFEQRLADLGRKMPVWFQPVWQVLVDWFVAWLRELKVAAEMASVDQQAAEISEGWAKVEDEERRQEAERVAGRIQTENPDATVSVIETAVCEGADLAILVEHPPDGSAAQELLGGAMEIRSPWVER